VAIANAFSARRDKFGSTRFAIIVKDKLVFGLKRMWEAYVEDNWDAEAKVFRSRKDAMNWILI
jgi:hypothetical protein